MKLSCLKLLSCVLVIVMMCSFPFTLTSYAYGPTAPNNDYCYIRAVKSGKYITVPNGTVSNGKEIKIYSANETASQRWHIYTYSDGYSVIRSAVNLNYYLSLKNSTSTNNAKLTIEYIASGSVIPSRAIFKFVSDTELGITYIINKSTKEEHNMNKVLEAYGGFTSDGTNIVNYDAHSGIDVAYNQFWVIESTSRQTALWGYDFVDSGGHCDWSSSSQYTDMVTEATSAWNNRLNKTIFRKDSLATLEDVKIVDSNQSLSSTQAVANTNATTKQVTFFTAAMEVLPADVVRMTTVTHELGHCLGLFESGQLGNIMKQGGWAYRTSISLDDVASYNLT